MPGLGTYGKFEISYGWRYSEAHKDYLGSHVNKLITNGLVPYERLSAMDVTAKYNINWRWSLSASLPIVENRLSLLIPPDGRGAGTRTNLYAHGIGDTSLLASCALLKKKQHPFENVSLGLGIKIPTGNWDRHNANIPDLQGNNFMPRAVFPPAMQPGDGGTGILASINAYKTICRPRILRGTTFFGSGLYLCNMRNTNGTPSVVAESGIPVNQLNPFFLNKLVNGVPDTYSMAAGISMPVPRAYDNPNLKGLRLLATYHLDGIRRHNLIGGNDGFRQPGWTMTIGPGAAWTVGKNTLVAECGLAFARYINPTQTLIPHPLPGSLNLSYNLGLVAPVTFQVRYIRAIGGGIVN